jgi:hypothetical protein
MNTKLISIILFLFILRIYPQSSYTKSFEKLTATESLAYSTIRLEVQTKTNLISGTAFFYNLFRKGNESILVIVTNKHMIKDAVLGRFYLNEANSNGTIKIGSFKPVVLNNFESLWLLHPDSTIDLAIMPIGPLIHQSEKEGVKVFFRSIDEDMIPDSIATNDLTAIEDILMIGYPIGIWDSKNNYPIFRRGITATHPALDYEKRPEFMIDCACYPGSSGSPVFLYKSGAFLGSKRETIFGEKLLFLGVLYGGPQFTTIGKLKILTIPEKFDTVSVFKIPTNLGNVIKSYKLKDFKNYFNVFIERMKTK